MVVQEVAMLNSYLNFIYMGTYYGIARFNLHYLESKDMPSLMNLMIMPVLCFLTCYSEKIGRRGIMLTVANALNVVADIWLLCLGTNDGGQYAYPVALMGLSFGVYTSYSWPVLSMTVGHVELITFGMTLCLVLESCFEFIIPLIVGIIDMPRDNAAYLKSTWIIFVLGIVGLISSIAVTFMDINGEKVLHNTPDEMDKQIEMEQQAAQANQPESLDPQNNTSLEQQRQAGEGKNEDDPLVADAEPQQDVEQQA